MHSDRMNSFNKVNHTLINQFFEKRTYDTQIVRPFP